MRRAAPLLALALLAVAPAAAQPQGATARTTDEVLAFRDRVRAAIKARDRAALERAYADNFQHLRDSGRVDLKGERLGILLSGEATIETAPEENLTVQVYGPTTVVATAVSPIRDPATGRGVPFRWLTLYVRGDDGWRVAMSQASRMPARR